MPIKKTIFLIIYSILLQFGCGPNDDDLIDDCNIPIEGITSLVDSSSTSFLENYLNNDFIYFENESNDTFVLNVINRIDSLYPYEEYTACEYDSTKNRFREGFIQMQVIHLSNIELDLDLIYRVLNPSLTKNISDDKLWINGSIEFLFEDPIAVYSTYNPIQQPTNPYTVRYDSLVIGNLFYHDVMEPNIENTGIKDENGIMEIPNPWVKFNQEYGLLSIKDTIKDFHLTYIKSE